MDGYVVGINVERVWRLKVLKGWVVCLVNWICYKVFFCFDYYLKLVVYVLFGR